LLKSNCCKTINLKEKRDKNMKIILSIALFFEILVFIQQRNKNYQQALLHLWITVGGVINLYYYN